MIKEKATSSITHETCFQRLPKRVVQGWCTCGFVVHDKVKRVVIQKLHKHVAESTAP